jgi:hemolysin activation/secretion protein
VQSTGSTAKRASPPTRRRERSLHPPNQPERIVRWLLVLAALAPMSASAQQLPGIGDVLRNVEKTRPQPPPQTQPKVDVEQPARPALQAPDTLRFHVDRIRLTGVTALPEADLIALLQPYVGRDLTLHDLEEAAAAITRLYRERGFPVARAYVPAQEIHDGVVELVVLEGRYGKVGVAVDAPLSRAVANEAVQPLRPDGVIEENALDRALLLLDDLGGVAARGTLKPGEKPGTADLVVDVTETERYGGTVGADNYGNELTGRYRLGGSFHADNLAGRGDTLAARAIVSQGSDLVYGQLAYNLPLTGDGLQAGAIGTYTNYTLGQGLSALGATGYAGIATAYARYALIRSHRGSLYTQLAFDAKNLEDKIGAAGTFDPRKESVATLTIFGDASDSGPGGGITSGSLAVAGGRLNIQDSTALAIDQATAQTEGGFFKLNYSLVRLQNLAREIQLYAAVSGQLTSKNVDPVEQFSLGGPLSVRAYPTGEAPGDVGILGTLELRWALPIPGFPGLAQAVTFLDSGAVQINKSPYSAAPNHRTLTGAGVGINFFVRGSLQLTASYAWALGDEPATGDSGRTSQGWIQLVKTF